MASKPSNRKTISKRRRFEIFKRDNFTCQYCGAHPPAAVLEIDHIVPVAAGGGNTDDNLVSACDDCNRGKGARLLSQCPQSLADRAEMVAEREEQLRGYNAIIESKRQRLDVEAERVNEIYEAAVPGFSLSRISLNSVRMFIEKLGVHQVMEAMEIACDRWIADDDRIFKYFCGVCWNKIKEGGQK